MPADLSALTPTPSRYPSNEERALIMDVLRNIPRPPHSLYELTSAAAARLLMNEWNLPPSMVAGIAAVDHVLVEPARQSRAEDKRAAGICYLAARLAERLVMGEISGPADIERFLDQDPDFFHVGSYLSGRISFDWRKALLSEETMAGFYS